MHSDQPKSADEKGDPREQLLKGERPGAESGKENEDLHLLDKKKQERIYDDLLDIVVEQELALPTEVYPESDIVDDLGMDSLDVYELVIDIEEKYSIRLTDENLERVRTVQDFVNLVFSMTQV